MIVSTLRETDSNILVAATLCVAIIGPEANAWILSKQELSYCSNQ